MQICFKCLQPIEGEVPTHGLHASCFSQWFGVDVSSDFLDVVLRKDKQELDFSVNPLTSSFFHGKFKKYSARLVDPRLANHLGDRSYILKVQDTYYPELPRVEYLSNQIAQQLGLRLPDFYLIRFYNEIDAFVVHNFIKDTIPGNLIHIYHFIQSSSHFSCSEIIRIIEEKVGRMEDVKQFVFLCLYDALIGNHDRHGRNIAFIDSPKGVKLTPFYDNPSYLGIEDDSLLLAQHNPRGKIATSFTDEPTMKDYVKEFERLGYQEWINEFRKRLNKIDLDVLIQKSFLTEKRKQSLRSLIHRRQKELGDHE